MWFFLCNLTWQSEFSFDTSSSQSSASSLLLFAPVLFFSSFLHPQQLLFLFTHFPQFSLFFVFAFLWFRRSGYLKFTHFSLTITTLPRSRLFVNLSFLCVSPLHSLSLFLSFRFAFDFSSNFLLFYFYKFKLWFLICTININKKKRKSFSQEPDFANKKTLLDLLARIAWS